MTDGPKRRKRDSSGSVIDDALSDNRNNFAKRTGEKRNLKVFLRVVIIALLFCVVAFGTLFLMDICSGNGTSEPEIITVAVLGDEIELHDGRKLNFAEFETYMAELDSKGDLVTVALITDSATPPDVELYNQVVRLLKGYGISCKEMTLPATNDEATVDET